MAEDVSIADDGTCIVVLSPGKPSPDEMRRTLVRIKALGREHSVDRVLVDASRRDALPPISILHDGARMLAAALGPAVRVAVLVNAVTDEHRYFENVAINEGADIAYFLDRDAAHAWLRAPRD